MKECFSKVVTGKWMFSWSRHKVCYWMMLSYEGHGVFNYSRGLRGHVRSIKTISIILQSRPCYGMGSPCHSSLGFAATDSLTTLSHWFILPSSLTIVCHVFREKCTNELLMISQQLLAASVDLVDEQNLAVSSGSNHSP